MTFDAASGAGDLIVSSLSWSHTCTGTNGILWVGVMSNQAGGVLASGVTYNGVAMTRVNSSSSGDSTTELWYLINPATGSHTITITMPGTTTRITGEAASYTSAQQSGVPDASGVNGSGLSSPPFPVGVTTVADNCWVVAAFMTYYDPDPTSAPTAESGTTIRHQDYNAQYGTICDSGGPITPAGVASLGIDRAGLSTWSAVAASFAPAGGGTPQPVAFENTEVVYR